MQQMDWDLRPKTWNDSSWKIESIKCVAPVVMAFHFKHSLYETTQLMDHELEDNEIT